MKYICLGYYDKGKFDSMSEGERNAMFDSCFEYDDHIRANGLWAISSSGRSYEKSCLRTGEWYTPRRPSIIAAPRAPDGAGGASTRCPSGGIGRRSGLRQNNLSPRGEIHEVKPVKVGEGPGP